MNEHEAAELARLQDEDGGAWIIWLRNPMGVWEQAGGAPGARSREDVVVQTQTELAEAGMHGIDYRLTKIQGGVPACSDAN